MATAHRTTTKTPASPVCDTLNRDQVLAALLALSPGDQISLGEMIQQEKRRRAAANDDTPTTPERSAVLTSEYSVTLGSEEAGWIRDALLIGLHCVAEVERVTDAVKSLRSCGHNVPENIVPLHPTGESAGAVVGRLSTAITVLCFGRDFA